MRLIVEFLCLIGTKLGTIQIQDCQIVPKIGIPRITLVKVGLFLYVGAKISPPKGHIASVLCVKVG